MNHDIKTLLDKWSVSSAIADLRGLLVYGLIHCQGSQTERRAALAKVSGKIRDWSGVRVLPYEDLLRTIVHFAAQGDL